MIRKFYEKTANLLGEKARQQIPEFSARHDQGLMTVEAASPWIYIHHDHGMARMSYEAAQSAIAADRIHLTVLNGLAPQE